MGPGQVRAGLAEPEASAVCEAGLGALQGAWPANTLVPTWGYIGPWVQMSPRSCFTHQPPWRAAPHPGMWGLYQELGVGHALWGHAASQRRWPCLTPLGAQSPRPLLGAPDFAKGTDEVTVHRPPPPAPRLLRSGRACVGSSLRLCRGCGREFQVPRLSHLPAQRRGAVTVSPQAGER